MFSCLPQKTKDGFLQVDGKEKEGEGVASLKNSFMRHYS